MLEELLLGKTPLKAIRDAGILVQKKDESKEGLFVGAGTSPLPVCL
jgi:hypothetical protein